MSNKNRQNNSQPHDGGTGATLPPTIAGPATQEPTFKFQVEELEPGRVAIGRLLQQFPKGNLADLVGQIDRCIAAFPEQSRNQNFRPLPLHVQILPDTAKLLRAVLEHAGCL